MIVSNKKSSHALIIGRFQPFHLGHLSAIKQALKKVDFLYIGIGSSQYHHEDKNPFTAKERKKIIEISLKKHQLMSRCKIFFIPDIHKNEEWTKHVKNIIPHFDILFIANNNIVKKLFQKEKDIKIINLEHEIKISASQIREAIRKEDKLGNFLDKEVLDYIKKIKAIKRIKSIYKTHPSEQDQSTNKPSLKHKTKN